MGQGFWRDKRNRLLEDGIKMDATANENGEDSTTLATLVKWHEDAEQATVDAREESQRARDYYCLLYTSDAADDTR